MQANLPAGFILLVVGGVLLARQMGVLFPDWLFRWEMILVAIGLFVGFRSGFRDFGWLIITGIGLFFMADDFFPEAKAFFWPVLIIAVGLLIMLNPLRQKKIPPADTEGTAPPPVQANTDKASQSAVMEEDVLDIASVFGGTKKLVLSKNFKGGEIVSVFGGADVNLTQADFSSPVKVEIVAIFGGAKLVVPANWEIRSETVAILGGIDDKREPVPAADPAKVLILEGVVMFGGIEINSY